jgi:hypothetical protein
VVGCFHPASSGGGGFPTCLLADKPPKKKLAVCFHKPPGNYHLIEERLPYGAALFCGFMMGLFVFTMMVKPVRMTISLLREKLVICMASD